MLRAPKTINMGCPPGNQKLIDQCRGNTKKMLEELTRGFQPARIGSSIDEPDVKAVKQMDDRLRAQQQWLAKRNL